MRIIDQKVKHHDNNMLFDKEIICSLTNPSTKSPSTEIIPPRTRIIYIIYAVIQMDITNNIHSNKKRWDDIYDNDFFPGRRCSDNSRMG